MTPRAPSSSFVTRVIYFGTFVGLALVATLSVVIYRSAVSDAVAQRSTQQLAMVRTAAVGLQGELQALSARIGQFNSIPSTQFLDAPVLPSRVNAAFSDNPHGIVQAIVRIDGDGRLYEWSPEGRLTADGVPTVLEPERWSRMTDAVNRGFVTVTPVWWRGDSPRQLRALVVPAWRTAPSDVHPVPPNDFNGVLAIVFDTRRLAEVYLGPALVELEADDLVVGLGVAASLPYDRAAAGIQRAAASQLGLTAALLIAVPLAGWQLARRERHAQVKQRRLERELAGAQKMEAIGKLAGGVAHDFNNMLTAILGYASLIHEDAPEGSPLREQAGQIRRAADNA